MALKKKIEKLEDVAETVRGEYKPVDAADPSKGFVLDLEGDESHGGEDVGALKRALDHVRNEAKAAKDALTAKGQETSQLEASYKAKIDALEASLKETTEKQIKAQRQEAKASAATELAAKLSPSGAKVLLPHIEKRLKVEIDADGKTLVRVLDADGKMTASSVADLEAEFRANKDFAPVIVGSRASGSGARQENQLPGGASGSDDPPPSDPAARAAWSKRRAAARGR
jgi:hypothetical protein